MSCDFEPKMVVSYIDRRLMYTEVNRKQKVSKQRKLNFLQDGYLGFSTFLDFDPQNYKKQVFSGKSALRSNMFKIFKKHESSSHAKFQIRISIFDPKMNVISVKCGDVIKRNHIFGPFIDIVHKNKLHRWIPEMKLNRKSAFYFQHFEFWKLTFFDLFWPDLEVKSENYRYH